MVSILDLEETRVVFQLPHPLTESKDNAHCRDNGVILWQSRLGLQEEAHSHANASPSQYVRVLLALIWRDYDIAWLRDILKDCV